MEKGTIPLFILEKIAERRKLRARKKRRRLRPERRAAYRKALYDHD